MKIEFCPEILTLGFFNKQVYSFSDIRDETMFFSCDPEFVLNNKDRAPITAKIMDSIVDSSNLVFKGNNVVIDTRVNMLMPGQYPSIPGWHCDDVPRGENGQPDFNLINSKVKHIMVLVSDTTDPEECISGTEFVTEKKEYDIDPNNVWNSLDKQVREDNNKKTRFVKEREIVLFNQMSIHRASPAKTKGWRLFFRLSLTHRKPVNEIRNHVQTYVDINNSGW